MVSYANSHTLRTCAHRAPLPASPAESTLARTTILARDAAASREVSDVDVCGGGVDVVSNDVGSTRLEDIWLFSVALCVCVCVRVCVSVCVCVSE